MMGNRPSDQPVHPPTLGHHHLQQHHHHHDHDHDGYDAAHFEPDHKLGMNSAPTIPASMPPPPPLDHLVHPTYASTECSSGSIIFPPAALCPSSSSSSSSSSSHPAWVPHFTQAALPTQSQYIPNDVMDPTAHYQLPQNAQVQHGSSQSLAECPIGATSLELTVSSMLQLPHNQYQSQEHQFHDHPHHSHAAPIESSMMPHSAHDDGSQSSQLYIEPGCHLATHTGFSDQAQTLISDGGYELSQTSDWNGSSPSLVHDHQTDHHHETLPDPCHAQLALASDFLPQEMLASTVLMSNIGPLVQYNTHVHEGTTAPPLSQLAPDSRFQTDSVAVESYSSVAPASSSPEAVAWLSSTNQLVHSPVSAHSANSLESTWTFVNPSPPTGSFDSLNIDADALFRPTVLHLRSHSGSSQEGLAGVPFSSNHSIGSFEELPFPMSSPETEAFAEFVPVNSHPQNVSCSPVRTSMPPPNGAVFEEPVVVNSSRDTLSNLASYQSPLVMPPAYHLPGSQNPSCHMQPHVSLSHPPPSFSVGGNHYILPTSAGPAASSSSNLGITAVTSLHTHSSVDSHSHDVSYSQHHPIHASAAHNSTSLPSLVSPLPVTAAACDTSQTTPPRAARRRKNTAPRAAAVNKRRQSTQLPSQNISSPHSHSNSPPPQQSPTEKRVGRRRGPLRPEQRQQAHEIRKLRACLRCKFLKKTCDTGDPCAGCQPTHARLWQVPCTRVDIRDIGFFLTGWTTDYERNQQYDFPYDRITAVSPSERRIKISHGYGVEMTLEARHVFISTAKPHDFDVTWVESGFAEKPSAHRQATSRLCLGITGITPRVVHQYLDEILLEDNFDRWVDRYFEGTEFITEMLKSLQRYYCRTKLPVLGTALKMVLAYALTSHITFVAGLPESEMRIGLVRDPSSRAFGQSVAPVLINFQVKKAFADTWRVLMKDILAQLSTLFASVYTGDKLKNWPTIFMLSILLLALWELQQFDCYYRSTDPEHVATFVRNMETTPVGVIVGLFAAISHQVPSFFDWDTSKHKEVLNSDADVCQVMTETRSHVEKHEAYLKTRPHAKYDRSDFDCLSNKFLSRLVIRAH